MSKVTVKFKRSSKTRRGSGQISWHQLQAMMRREGLLMAGQHIEKIEATKEGIMYTTSKTGNQK